MKNLNLIKKEMELLNGSEMSSILGGNSSVACGCACAYENKGGSSTSDNANANSADGKHSTEVYKVVVRKDGTTVKM